MMFNLDIKEALTTLRKGGLILYPTDTIWGLGCDATNTFAVEKIYKLKRRSESVSLIILVNGIQMAERYVRDIPDIVYDLVGVSDSPLTIIYPKGKNLSPGVCSKDGSVGIRICHDEFCQDLIGRLQRPLVSTSANISGKPSPENFTEIDKSIVSAVDFVVKYRQDDQRKYTSSPIIKVEENGTIKIIRK